MGFRYQNSINDTSLNFYSYNNIIAIYGNDDGKTRQIKVSRPLYPLPLFPINRISFFFFTNIPQRFHSDTFGPLTFRQINAEDGERDVGTK